MATINPHLLVIGLFLHFMVIRLSGYFLPDEFYFSFAAFLMESRELARPAALAAKLAIPVAVSFALVGALCYRRSIETGVLGRNSTVQVILSKQAAITLGFAALIMAVLMAWPYILLWDLLVEPELARHRFVFLLAYMAYFVASAYFAMAGANAALSLFSERAADAQPLTFSSFSESRVGKPLADAISGMIAASVAAFLGLQAT